MASLYSYKYGPQEKTNSEDEDNDEINSLIEDEVDEEEHNVVVKSKMKRKKPQIILETSEISDNKIYTEHGEVVKVTKKSLESHCIQCLNHQKMQELYKKNSKDTE